MLVQLLILSVNGKAASNNSDQFQSLQKPVTQHFIKTGISARLCDSQASKGFNASLDLQ